MLPPQVLQANDIDFSPGMLPRRPEPLRALMVRPDYFDVVDVKNVHMEGQHGKVDKQKAWQQWQKISDFYQLMVREGILEAYREIPGVKGLEDMVFAANQTFPWLKEDGTKQVVLSNMRHPNRQKEVPHFEKFFRDEGYEVIKLESEGSFEGMGDAIPHPGKRLIYGGYGHRTDVEVYEEIAEKLNTPVIPLELQDEKFYHLDTCFLPVNEETVMLRSEAFSSESMEAIVKLFPYFVSIPADEAEECFSLNAHCICNPELDAWYAIVPLGSRYVWNELVNKGYRLYEVDTSEFIKSGGSVFCMKMMYY